MAEPTIDGVLSIRNASVQIRGRTIWSGVNLDVCAGEFVTILGPNGAGKSTLLKAVLGLLPLSAGEIRVLGKSPGAATDAIGYLPQRRSFDADLRVRGIDIVRLGLDGQRWGIPIPGIERFFPSRKTETNRVHEVIDLVGATAYAKRPIGQVSGGEQQRLLIAQALIRRPKLLFLDEPLDSLDLPNQAAVASLIASISRQEQVTVFMVAHDVNPILAYVDQVVYIAQGGAVSGSPSEVITTETLSRLFSSPIEVLKASDGRLVVVGQPDAPIVHGGRHDHVHHLDSSHP